MTTEDPKKIELARQMILKSLGMYMYPFIMSKSAEEEAWNRLKEPATLETAEGTLSNSVTYHRPVKGMGLANIYRQINMIKRNNEQSYQRKDQSVKPYSVE